jgi:hypothetical protein
MSSKAKFNFKEAYNAHIEGAFFKGFPRLGCVFIL